MTLERYREIVDDWDRFWEVSHTPEPITFRVRAGLIAPSELTSRLRSKGFRLEPVDELEDYFRVIEGPGSVAQTIEYWLGLLHIQQAVMGLPALALSPRPGDRVLDLCSAPGGKTTHLSELMGEEGPLVAVDSKEKRIRKAIHLTRPGGTIVYSTCTYAPEENEAILDRVLRYAAVTLEEIPLHLPHTPGVLAWEGQRFHPHIARAWRLYPHHMNSGGLFMARLRRRGIDHSVDSSASHRGTTPPNGWSEIPSGFPGEAEDAASVRIERAIDELVQWFDLSRSALDGVGWMVRNKHIWAQTAKIWPVAGWTGAVKTAGGSSPLDSGLSEEVLGGGRLRLATF